MVIRFFLQNFIHDFSIECGAQVAKQADPKING
jgi:hypothetical protein